MCDTVFKRKKIYDKHQEEHAKYNCKKCSETFIHLIEREQHQRICSEDITCKKCRNIFGNNLMRNNHQRTCGTTKNVQLKCKLLHIR